MTPCSLSRVQKAVRAQLPSRSSQWTTASAPSPATSSTVRVSSSTRVERSGGTILVGLPQGLPEGMTRGSVPRSTTRAATTARRVEGRSPSGSSKGRGTGTVRVPGWEASADVPVAAVSPSPSSQVTPYWSSWEAYSVPRVVLGVWSGQAAPSVMATVTPRCWASASTARRAVRWASSAQKPGEKAISTSPNPASAMARSSSTSSAGATGDCHHQRMPGRSPAGGAARRSGVRSGRVRGRRRSSRSAVGSGTAVAVLMAFLPWQRTRTAVSGTVMITSRVKRFIQVVATSARTRQNPRRRLVTAARWRRGDVAEWRRATGRQGGRQGMPTSYTTLTARGSGSP